MLTDEQLSLELRVQSERMQHRVNAIVERDGSTEAAVTGKGVGISYLFARDVAKVMSGAAERMDRLTQTPSTASVRDDAIEDAAVVVDCAAAEYERAGLPSTHWKNIASAIRALKSPSPPVSGKEG